MNKRFFYFFSIIVIMSSLVFLMSCSQNDKDSSEDAKENTTMEVSRNEAGVYTKITAEEAYEMIQCGDVIIVDVRTQAEYDEGHIANAVLIPNEEIGDTPPEALPDKDATILIYCRSGNRSAKASHKLIKMGYTKVFDFGGINKWTYGVEKP